MYWSIVIKQSFQIKNQFAIIDNKILRIALFSVRAKNASNMILLTLYFAIIYLKLFKLIFVILQNYSVLFP